LPRLSPIGRTAKEVCVSDERRQVRKEIRLIQSESVWLQKALFALRKAEAAREKVADAREEKQETYSFAVGGSDLLLEDLEESLEARIELLVQKVREMRKSLR
jgi:hypothetical protein